MLLASSRLHAADDADWLSLIAPKSLDGWNAGPLGDMLDEVWTVKDGVMRGTNICVPLYSSWTFGDFELRMTFAHGPCAIVCSSGTTGDDKFQILIPAKFDGSSSSATLRRVGPLFTFTLDGESASEQTIDKLRAARVRIELASEGEIRSLQVREPRGEPIFNSENLDGWWTPGNPESWIVDQGSIACVNKKGDYLRSEKEYGNFVLSFLYKIAKGGNSGLGIRTPRNGWPSGDGMEVQIEDRPAGEPLNGQSPGAIYSNVEPFARADVSEQWNRMVVKAEGYMISVWMNGELVQCVNTYWQPELKHRHLKGWIGFQDHNNHVEYRDIRVLELPDGRGLDEWYAAREPWGSQVIVDRLMNPDALCRDGDSTVTLSATKMPAAKSEPLRSEVTIDGPGALVGVFRSNDRGTVQLFLDGESKPRVDCPANELRKHVPALSNDSNPLLVYIPFKKSLRVVLEDSKSEYAFDVARFDKNVRIEALRGPTDTLPRGLLASSTYRAFQHSHGGMRKEDPYPKAASEKKTIEPGKTDQLLKVEGAAVMDWFRLKCPNKSLTNDELWLNVTVDGEKSPAISAPVRYLFPGLSDGKNYRNFVVTSKNGFTNRLAMPFSDGISLSVTNKGKRAVKDVELAVSYQPKTKQEAASLLRLRSSFRNKTDEHNARLIPVFERLLGFVYAPDVHSEGLFDAALELPSKPADMKQTLNGRSGGLVWRWWLMGPPPPANEEFAVPESTKVDGGMLILYYGR
jgi:hypothetical protein